MDGYALSIDLRADGTAVVDERVTADFDRNADALHLPIPAFRVDQVAGHTASIDGAPVREPGVAVEAVPGGGVVVGAGRLAGPQEIRQTYEARGVFELQGARALFIWPAVPASLGVAGEAVVRVRFPPGSVPAGVPTVDRDGWRVAFVEGGAELRGSGPAVTDAPWFYVDLVLDDLTGREPAWQATARRARLLAPAFVAAGLFLVVVGIGVLIMLRWRYPPRPDPAMDAERPAVARSLCRAGLVVMASAAAGAMVLPWLLPGLGWPPYAVPAGLGILGAMVYGRGATFPVTGEAGVLHSPRFRQHREP